MYDGPTGELITCYGDFCEIYNNGEWDDLVETRATRRGHSSAAKDDQLLLLGGSSTISTEWISSDGSPSQPGSFNLRSGYMHYAEELKLKVLMGQMEDAEKEIDLIPQQMNPKPNREKSSLNTEPIEPNLRPKKDENQMSIERRIAIPNFVSGDLQELDEKVKSMMEKSQNRTSDGTKMAKICKVCGKEGH